MDINKKDSIFQEVILELIRSKLNLMLSETFQLKKEVDSSNYLRLTKIILKEIAKGEVKSIHMQPLEAKKAIKILDMLNCHNEIGHGLQEDISDNDLTSGNPFENNPF